MHIAPEIVVIDDNDYIDIDEVVDDEFHHFDEILVRDKMVDEIDDHIIKIEQIDVLLQIVDEVVDELLVVQLELDEIDDDELLRYAIQ